MRKGSTPGHGTCAGTAKRRSNSLPCCRGCGSLTLTLLLTSPRSYLSERISPFRISVWIPVKTMREEPLVLPTGFAVEQPFLISKKTQKRSPQGYCVLTFPRSCLLATNCPVLYDRD